MNTFSEETYRQIDAYLDQQMSEADLLTFEARLKAEPDLMTEVEAQWKSRLAIVAAGEADLRDALNSMKADLKQESPVIQPFYQRQGFWMWAGAVAAGVLILFLIFRPSPAIPPEKLFADTFEMPDALRSRTGQTRVDSVLQEARNAYAEGNLSQSSESYIAYLNEHPDHPESQYYLAAMLLKNGNTTEAIRLYSSLINDPNLGRKSTYYLSLALLKAGNIQGAIAQMKSLGEQLSPEEKNLLEELKRLEAADLQ